MNSRLLYIYLCIALLCSCNGEHNGASSISPAGSQENVQYAEGFDIEHYPGFSTVTLHNPWSEGKVLHKYVLLPKESEMPSNLPEGTIVRTPIDKIVAYTSVHASIIEELGETGRIAGVCEPQYLTSENIKALVSNGKIANIGEASAPNIEKILDINTEVILASPFENMGHGAAEKLGIPIVEGADYMENTPLGRAEWIKFYGLLLGKGELADSLFSETVAKYEDLKALAANTEFRPTVITERKYGTSWPVPGGGSYMAKIMADAGADYIFSDNDEKGVVNISFEKVLEKGGDADFWLLKYASERPITYTDLRSEYQPYEYFSPYKNKKIYSCNTIATPYYDEVMLHPEYLLADFIRIFHPEITLSKYKQRYFFPML